MDPVLSQAIATLIGAIATAILLYATTMWGPNSRRRRDEDEDDE